MEITRLIRIIFIFAVIVLMTACGYQLRQTFSLPQQYSPVQIQVPRQHRELRSVIEEQLERSFIDVAKPGEDAGLFIRLEKVEALNDLLTASAEGTPLERELTLRANVLWVDAQGAQVIESERFRLRRAYAYDDQAILAKAREADYLMQEMERDLAQRIVIRLRQLSQ